MRLGISKATVPLLVTTWLAAQSPPPFKSLRYDEDWRYLRDPERSADTLDRLKWLPLSEDGTTGLTLGGEARLRYELYRNSQWGAGPQDVDGYLLQRYMLHGDLHVGDGARLFAQLKSGLESGRNGGPRPTDEDRFDLHQAFVDVCGELGGRSTLTARLGRQELQYGGSRLVSVRESPNVRQSFDGARLLLAAGAWRADAFVTRPVETDPGELDDGSDQGRAFYGVYATGSLALLPDGHADLYYLELDRDEARFDQGAAKEERRSLGTRLFGKPKPFDYDFEAVWQFGSFGDGRIEAWTVASDTGITLSLGVPARVSLKADIASGDRNASADTLQTFHALFPRGAYFGEPALIGPANIIDLHPAVEAWPSPGCRIYADWDAFWRQSTADGLYGSSLVPLRSGASSGKRWIGSQVQLGTEWQIQRHVTVAAVYAHFFAGSFLEESGSSEDIDYVSAWVTVKF